MRNTTALDALFPKIRQNLLAATVLNPERWWYLSNLAQSLSVTPSSLQRELSSLVIAGILERRQDGNRVYYRPDPACPFLPDLQGLLAKTIGLVDILKEVLKTIEESLEFAFIYGSVARGEQTSGSDIDLMLIGSLTLSTFATALREAERRLRRPINPTLFTLQEFKEKFRCRNHFLRTVMQSEKTFLIGNVHELAAIIE